MMISITLNLQKGSEVSSAFLESFLRLAEEKVPFTIGWHQGERIYIDSPTSSPPAFICLDQAYKSRNLLKISTLNFAIAQSNCEFNFAYGENELIFLIFSNKNTIQKINNFLNCLSSSE